MAAVRGLRVSVKAEAPAGPPALGLPSPEVDSGLERGEPEPMEVEEGELEIVPVRRSLKELLPDTSRRYENKAGSFITGIDVTSKEAIEKKEQRAKRFHFRAEVNLAQRNVALDRDMMKKAIPKVRLETIYICGVDEMSTQDIFSYFKEYPPAHIEWLDDTSYKQEDSSDDDETEEGEVEDENSSDVELDTLSQVEEESLLRNDLRPANKLAKGNRLFMRFATKDDKKELGAARRSQYYMKYGNPNYGGMKGILSNSWKRRYHSRRIQRDVIKKRALIGDDVGLTSYKHRHSGLVNVPEEPIEEEEEEEEDQDMDADDRVVVEYPEELPALKQPRERSVSRRSSASSSDSDEMDYDLELKMISTPSPKKSMKMTMYADEVESQLKSIRNSMRADSISTSNIKNRIGNKLPPEKFADVRHLLDEKRQHSCPRPAVGSTKPDIRQRLGKRPYSPEKAFSSNQVVRREPSSDVHSRLGVPRQDVKGLYSDTRERKSGGLWTRLGSTPKTKEKNTKKVDHRPSGAEEDDSELQRAWGALIKEKEQSRQKKSRLDSLPSLQIEVSRENLMPLGAFNVDVAWPWVTALKPGAPSVLSSFLHHDPSTNQTCLLVTRHSTKKTSAPLHRCAISIIPDEIACHPVENISMPKGSYKGVTVVRNHHGILCSFALVQYGYVIQTEFDLRDSQDVMASLARVQSIVQVKNVTKTASAMQHVLDNIFTPSRGSRKKASKVMVVLTDGDIFGDPLNLTTVINSPKMQGIERFAIGVGDAFKKAKTDRELKLIASDPKETHTFKVTNYMALDGLLSKLQQSIIHMEGTVGDALQYQLAQTGFSAQILDKVLLGTVGAFNWSGGALLYDTRSRRGSFLNQTAEDSGAAQYSYLGYSVAVLHMVFGFSYVAGAPRHKIRGAVFQLQKEDRKATFVRRLEGEQMGSYFGSELCSVDIDMDGTTDFLLVAAPFYHIRGEEGRVYVYRVHEQDASFSLARTLSGHPGLTNSRFGFAMAAVGDINQDKFTDVAIGAPLEGFEAGDGTSYGSVYIYNGHSDGLRASPSQRIRASSVALGLHYFGLSVAGGLDSNGDGLADITVGSRDRAAVLRSQPVVDLAVSMTFIPAALPMFFKDNVDVELCFEVASSTTASNPGLREMSLNFTVDVDVTKQRKRLQCTNTTNCQSYLRNWNGESSQCEQLSFIPMEEKLCDGDCFSNITIKVSYEFQTLGGKGDHPNPILDHYKDPSAVFQLPYEKDCKNKVFCIAEVQLTTAISQ
ncbi:integrin alpha E epithelial-associated [Cricetulus griseus]